MNKSLNHYEEGNCMFKKILLATLLVSSMNQAHILKEMQENEEFQNNSIAESAAYFENNIDAIAAGSDTITFSLSLAKNKTTSEAAWLELFRHVIAIMKSKNPTDCTERINRACFDLDLNQFSGKINMTLGGDDGVDCENSDLENKDITSL